MEKTIIYVLAAILGLIGTGFIAWLRKKLETGAVTFTVSSKTAEECEKQLASMREECEKIKKENEDNKTKLLFYANAPRCPWNHRAKSGCKYVDYLETKNEEDD